jgi:hypothetical protein
MHACALTEEIIRSVQGSEKQREKSRPQAQPGEIGKAGQLERTCVRKRN